MRKHFGEWIFCEYVYLCPLVWSKFLQADIYDQWLWSVELGWVIYYLNLKKVFHKWKDCVYRIWYWRYLFNQLPCLSYLIEPILGLKFYAGVRMLNEIRKPEFRSRNEIQFYTFGKRNSNLFIFSFLSGNLHRNFQMSGYGKINSHICLMMNGYKNFRQTVKYGQQRNYILQDLTGLEILISMKTNKTENRFSTTEIQFAKNWY